MKKRYIAIGVLIAFLGLLVNVYLNLKEFSVYPESECVSPSEEYAATFFYAGGGGGAGWGATVLTVWKVSEGFNPENYVYRSWENNEIQFQWLDDQTILIFLPDLKAPTEKTVQIGNRDFTLIYRHVDSTVEDGIPLNFKVCPDDTAITTFESATWTGWSWKDVIDK